MKQRLFILLLLFPVFGQLFAQPELIPYRKGDQWGFCDREKNIFIVPQHDEVFPFINGYARVRNGTRFGVIDMQGRIIVPIAFDYVSDESEGMFAARQGVFPASLAGYYDTSGRAVIPFRFIETLPFKNGKAMVKLGKFPELKHVFIDRNGKMLDYYGASGDYQVMGLPSQGMTRFKKGGKWGFLNSDGVEIMKPTYEDAGDFKEGLAYVKNKGKYGYIDLSGSVVIPFKFDMATDFFKGVAIVYELVNIKDEFNSETPKYGLIDKKGVALTPMHFDFIGLFDKEDKVAVVRKDNKQSFIDLKGKEIIPFKYDVVSEFHEGVAVVKALVGGRALSGIIDKTGKEIVPLSDIRFNRFSEGLIAFEKDRKVGFMNTKGEIVISAKYDGFIWRNFDRTSGSSEFVNGICPVLKGGQITYINVKGEEYAED